MATEIITSRCRTCGVAIKDYAPADYCPPCAAAKDRQPAERGDIFCTPEGVVVRVSRASRSDLWVDIQAFTRGGTVAWSKRMPTGIPASWARYPR